MHGLLFAGLLATLPLEVLGHPGSQPTNKLNRRAIELSSFHSQSRATYVNAARLEKDSSINISKRGDYVNTATEFVKSIAPDVTYRLVDGHYVGTNGIAHVHFRQTIHGIDIENAEFNVNVGETHHLYHIKPK